MTIAKLGALPGASLIRRGVADLGDGRESAEAPLVSIGAPRLRSVGIELPRTIPSPEHKLYLLLARGKGDAGHSAYNALIRREGKLSFHHFDPVAQALSKVERGHDQDIRDVQEMIAAGLVNPAEALIQFKAIEPELFRFPAIDPDSFHKAVDDLFAQ
jgi:hypothetical protein